MNNVIEILHVKYVLHQTRIKGRTPKQNPRRKILSACGRNDTGKPGNSLNAAETAEGV